MSGRIRNIEDFGPVQLLIYGSLVSERNFENSLFEKNSQQFERILSNSRNRSIGTSCNLFAYEAGSTEIDDLDGNFNFVSQLGEFCAKRNLPTANDEISMHLREGPLCGSNLKIFKEDGWLIFEFFAEESSAHCWLLGISETLLFNISTKLAQDVRLLIRDRNENCMCFESKKRAS